VNSAPLLGGAAVVLASAVAAFRRLSRPRRTATAESQLDTLVSLSEAARRTSPSLRLAFDSEPEHLVAGVLGDKDAITTLAQRCSAAGIIDVRQEGESSLRCRFSVRVSSPAANTAHKEASPRVVAAEIGGGP
jgi:hypothetical protein